MFGLSACDQVEPSGQVVAIVNGEEVTTGELRAEAAARGLGNAEDPAARAELLRDVVDRKLWVQQARRGKLDQQIEFVLARRRAEEDLLAGLLTRQLRDSVEPPSDGEISRFLRDNPSAFASRTMFQIDQIDFRPGGNPLFTERLAQAGSLEEVEKMLSRSGTVSQRSRTEWNSLFMPPPLAAKLRRLPSGRPFLHRYGGRMVAGVVRAKTDVPVAYRDREILTRRSLTEQRINAAVNKRLAELRSSADISHQPNYPLGY